MPTLYRISQEILEIIDTMQEILLAEEDADGEPLSESDKEELLAEQKQKLGEMKLSFSEKAEIIVSLISEYDASAEYKKKEKIRIEKLQKGDEKTAKLLRDYLLENMKTLEEKKIKGELHVIWRQKNPPSVHYDDAFDPNILPDEFKKTIVEPRSGEIIKYYKKNKSLPWKGVRVSQDEGLRFR